MNSEWIRFAGIALNVCGSLVLAIRVTRILRALALVATCHEANLQTIIHAPQVQVQFLNSITHVERARKAGLLVAGFSLIIIGLVLQGVATYLHILSSSA